MRTPAVKPVTRRRARVVAPGADEPPAGPPVVLALRPARAARLRSGRYRRWGTCPSRFQIRRPSDQAAAPLPCPCPNRRPLATSAAVAVAGSGWGAAGGGAGVVGRFRDRPRRLRSVASENIITPNTMRDDDDGRADRGPQPLRLRGRLLARWRSRGWRNRRTLRLALRLRAAGRSVRGPRGMISVCRRQPHSTPRRHSRLTTPRWSGAARSAFSRYRFAGVNRLGGHNRDDGNDAARPRHFRRRHPLDFLLQRILDHRQPRVGRIGREALLDFRHRAFDVTVRLEAARLRRDLTDFLFAPLVERLRPQALARARDWGPARARARRAPRRHASRRRTSPARARRAGPAASCGPRCGRRAGARS